MNHICEPGHAVATPSFTAKQGQYLAYCATIWVRERDDQGEKT